MDAVGWDPSGIPFWLKAESLNRERCQMANVSVQELTSIRRWKWAVLFALVVFPASVSSAAPEKYDFKLKMSQDKQLCPAITKVLSATYSFDVPPSHDWFTAIQWQELGTLGEQFRDEPLLINQPCFGDRWAKFDIDNEDSLRSSSKDVVI